MAFGKAKQVFNSAKGVVEDTRNTGRALKHKCSFGGWRPGDQSTRYDPYEVATCACGLQKRRKA